MGILQLSNRKQAFPCNSWKIIFEQNLEIFCSPLYLSATGQKLLGGGVGSLALQVLQWTGVLWTLCLELG